MCLGSSSQSIPDWSLVLLSLEVLVLNDVEPVESSCEFSFLLSLKILAFRCDRNMSLSVSSSSVFSDSCASVHNTLSSLCSERLLGRYWVVSFWRWVGHPDGISHWRWYRCCLLASRSWSRRTGVPLRWVELLMEEQEWNRDPQLLTGVRVHLGGDIVWLTGEGGHEPQCLVLVALCILWSKHCSCSLARDLLAI